MIVYVLLSVTSQNLIADAFTSLALTIAFYYGFTGFACVIFYRRHLFDSAKNFFFIGVLPFVGGAILTWVLVKAVIDYSKPDGGYAKPVLGIGSPIAIALVMIILGVVGMIIQRVTMPEFFKRKPEVVDPIRPGAALRLGVHHEHRGDRRLRRVRLRQGGASRGDRGRQGVRREGRSSRSATSSIRSPARSTITTLRCKELASSGWPRRYR